jgi:hypothetical protein
MKIFPPEQSSFLIQLHYLQLNLPAGTQDFLSDFFTSGLFEGTRCKNRIKVLNGKKVHFLFFYLIMDGP